MTEALTINQMKNNCTLVAVREVTRKLDAEIFAVFRQHGYVDNRGMINHKWIKAARVLGCDLEEIPLRVEGRACYVENYMGDSKYRCPNLRLSEFIKKFNVGTFFVSVAGHALVVRNGKVVDHNRWNGIGLGRIVRTAHRVLNAPEIKQELSEFLMVVKGKCKRAGTAAYDRYFEMRRYTDHNKDATLDDVIKNTPYTRADFNHDFAKGYVNFRPK